MIEGIPILDIEVDKKGVPVWKLFTLCGLCKSHSEAIRMARQGGLYVEQKGKWIRLSETQLNQILYRN